MALSMAHNIAPAPQFLAERSGNVEEPVFVPLERDAHGSQLADFLRFCDSEKALSVEFYWDFEAAAIEDFRTFWLGFLNWSKIEYDGFLDSVCEGDLCETARFFPNVRINFAEVLLAGPDDAWVLTACHSHRPPERIRRAELRRRVVRLGGALRELGVCPGDRVAAIARNSSEAVVAALAVAAVGAVFSSGSPEMGPAAIISRLGPLRPKVLIANVRAEAWDIGTPVAARLAEVASALDGLEHIVALDDGEIPAEVRLPTHRFADLIQGSPDVAFDFERFAFNHPLLIMFSSGTTGPPKCIVHGAGGTLIEHLKEHRLHCDLGPKDKLYFHTSCAWMMWNWQLSALASGVEIVLYDGVVQGPDTLWRMVSEQGVTVFGTSPAYLQLCEAASFSPRRLLDLGRLRSVLSTGSILLPQQYDWAREHVGNVPLQSISGGTDIVGCFVLGNPLLPVHRGQAQCRSLALDVRSHPQPEDPTSPIGELICANPFPSRPLGFFGDEEGRRFHESYFSQFPPYWRHGDLIELTTQGGARLHGRSDGVLNIRGIRIGPAEISGILSSLDPIVEVMAVEQDVAGEAGGSRLILLVVLRPGATLDDDLRRRIRLKLLSDGSAALVPSSIVQVEELPTTFNGKRSEVAAREAVNGREPRNLAALQNPWAVQALAEAVRKAEGQAPERTGASLADTAPTSLAEMQAALLALFSERAGFAIRPDDEYLGSGIDSLQLLTLLMEVEELVG